MSGEDEFLPIPGWPGYAVSRRGQVRSEFSVLACDSKGRVRLRNKATRRQSLFFTGELMGLAGLLADSPADAFKDELLAARRERDTLERHVAGLREELAAASRSIDRGRRLNGHLMARLRKLLPDDPPPAPKRGCRPRPKGEIEDEATPLDFETLAW